MKTFSRLHPIVILLLVFVCLFTGTPNSVVAVGSAPSIQVYFSPRGGATDAAVREIAAARSEILVQAYSFTSAPIAKALVEAHKRGVKVYVVLDKSQQSGKYTSADFIAHAGIATYIDDKHAIAHNKIMIFDRSAIITGSFNFTKAAEEKNAENLLLIKGDADLVRKYLVNWKEHQEHSEPYSGR